MSKIDKVLYKLGMVALCVVGFCWGWNYDNICKD